MKWHNVFRYGLLRRMRRGERIYFYVTDRCSLDCPYCTGKYGKTTAYDEIGVDGWFEFVDNLPERFDGPVQEIFISGGEPFIFDDVERLISHILEKTNAMLTVFTNLVGVIEPARIRRSLRLRFVASYHLGMNQGQRQIWQDNYDSLITNGFNVVVERFSNDVKVGKYKPLLNTDSEPEMNHCYIKQRHIFAPDLSYKKNLIEMLLGEPCEYLDL